MNVILYKGQTCPKCKAIAFKLDQKKIPYSVVTDVDYMLSIGVHSIPTLEVDGERYVDVVACNNWIKSWEGAK